MRVTSFVIHAIAGIASDQFAPTATRMKKIILSA
jgi:hypothetical protein